MRKIKFANDGYYHIYNRGVDKREIFCDEEDYLRFLKRMREFNSNLGDSQRDYIKRTVPEKKRFNLGYPRLNLFFSPLVEIVCYCLNPNHYHIILKQLADGGITQFMKKLGTGYTMFFNQKNNRSGSLFQGTFKAVEIKTNEQLLYVSGYINANAEIHKISRAENWRWSSYRDYLGLRNGTLCNKEIILDQFENIGKYKDYVNMVIKESRERKDLIKNFEVQPRI